MQNYKITEEDLDQQGYIKIKYPKHVLGEFACSMINLTSLKGVPKIVNESFDCSYTKLISLEYGPIEVHGGFFCTGIEGLKSFEHAPLIVGKDFFGVNTSVESLEGIGRKYLKEIGGDLYLPKTLKSNILGIMLIKNLQMCFLPNIDPTNRELGFIITKHLQGDRDVLECQEELIDKGFKEYAKL